MSRVTNDVTLEGGFWSPNIYILCRAFFEGGYSGPLFCCVYQPTVLSMSNWIPLSPSIGNTQLDV